MQTLVIVGISGDLSRRKLLPALRALKERGALPLTRIIGTSRHNLEVESLMEPNDPLAGLLEVSRLDVLGDVGDAIFYLAVPPGTVPAALKLFSASEGSILALEKPFGVDAASARTEAAAIDDAFAAGRVYRIDHYLAKPLVSRLCALNLDLNQVERIEVVAGESLGLEGRAGFYEATGALRDFGNHLLSLLCSALGAHNGHGRAQQLKELSLVRAARAQYLGYQEELSVQSQTETFVALELAHARLPGVPIVLISGKALAEKKTYVRIWQGGEMQTYAQLPDDTDSYERVFEALMVQDRSLFLEQEEIAESWCIMDQARQEWGVLGAYERGAPLTSVLGHLGF